MDDILSAVLTAVILGALATAVFKAVQGPVAPHEGPQARACHAKGGRLIAVRTEDGDRLACVLEVPLP